MAEIRKSKTVTKKEDLEYLYKIDEKDITTSFIMNTFADFGKGPRFNPFDIITIPKGLYGPDSKKNKNLFITTVGLWVYNKFFIEKDLFDIFHYINETVNSKLDKKINTTLSQYVTEDKIELAILDRYLLKQQKAMPYINILAYNYSEKMLCCTRAINKKKHELLQKYKEGIESGDPLVGDKMEKELLAYAIEYMGDDPSMDMFTSGARGNVSNNFKNMFVMKGVIKNPDPNAKQKYTVAMSNYIDGISPDEYALFANSLAAGPYARAHKTQIGGHWEKLFLYALQHIKLLDAGSDCGSKLTISVFLTEKNVSMYMYMYIVSGNNTIELTSDNKNKYIGKKVQFRYSSLCKAPEGCICNKCMGNLPYRLGVKNIGTATTQIPSTLKNISMKAFHDSTQQLTELDLNTIFK